VVGAVKNRKIGACPLKLVMRSTDPGDQNVVSRELLRKGSAVAFRPQGGNLRMTPEYLIGNSNHAKQKVCIKLKCMHN
jgi:hypothetical protein